MLRTTTSQQGFLGQGVSQHQAIRQIERPSTGFWIGYGAIWLARRLFRVLWSIRITLLWTALTVFSVTRNDFRLFAVELAVLAALVYVSTRNKAWIAALPVASDYRRWSFRRNQMKLIRNGNELLAHVGIDVTAGTGELNPVVKLIDGAEDKPAVLRVEAGIPGYPNSKIVSQVDTFKDSLGAVRVSAEPLDTGVAITLYDEDPLDRALTIEEPMKLDERDMKVECAIDSYGSPLSIKFGDSSGMVIGGLPGSGKTAGATSFLLPLALSEHVNLSIIDGKGGQDWDSYAPVADTFIKGDEELEPIAEFLERVTATMYDRLESQRERLGTSNYWSATPEERLAAGERFELVVIDECQGVFETTGRSKEDKELIGRITRCVSTLVKRGRSAGMFVILMTQKPTTDALPSAIRDNCGVAVAFRVTTPAAETAILGSLPDALDTPRATEIPQERKGGAVMATDTGRLTAARFHYMDEERQESIIKQSVKAGARSSTSSISILY